jgi:signal transduction histidine kinase
VICDVISRGDDLGSVQAYGLNMVPMWHRYGDAALALLLACGASVELLAWGGAPDVWSLLLVVVSTVPIALRRTAPLVSFVSVQVGLHLLTHLNPGFDNDSMAFVVAYLLSLYSVGRHASGTEAWLAAGGVMVAMGVFFASEGGSDLGDVAFVLAVVGSPYAAGLTLRLRREREVVLMARNAALRAEQEERARRAVTEERSRIARELHDVVSHAISVTVLQARGARWQLGRSEEDVRRALDAIEQTNTAALGDMRRLLAVLRDTDSDPVTTPQPQPSLQHLDALVREVSASGVPVSVELDGAPLPVPPGVDLSAYRIIQEALTNVLKHAGPARATVRLAYGSDALVVSIHDDGAAATVPNGSGSGHGLIGIRERVAVVGGAVTAGPAADGGFEVRARLPYTLEAP